MYIVNSLSNMLFHQDMANRMFRWQLKQTIFVWSISTIIISRIQLRLQVPCTMISAYASAHIVTRVLVQMVLHVQCKMTTLGIVLSDYGVMAYNYGTTWTSMVKSKISC